MAVALLETRYKGRARSGAEEEVVEEADCNSGIRLLVLSALERLAVQESPAAP